MSMLQMKNSNFGPFKVQSSGCPQLRGEEGGVNKNCKRGIKVRETTEKYGGQGKKGVGGCPSDRDPGNLSSGIWPLRPKGQQNWATE